MKPSKLMLKGYAMVGEQCKGFYFIGDQFKPCAVCALGAYKLARFGNANKPEYNPLQENFSKHFEHITGMTIPDANDGGMLIEDIAGILAAEGM